MVWVFLIGLTHGLNVFKLVGKDLIQSTYKTKKLADWYVTRNRFRSTDFFLQYFKGAILRTIFSASLDYLPLTRRMYEGWIILPNIFFHSPIQPMRCKNAKYYIFSYLLTAKYRIITHVNEYFHNIHIFLCLCLCL